MFENVKSLSSISTTEPPLDENFQTLTEKNKNRSFKWDQASGQFSFSQEEEAHLQRAVEEMEEMCRKSPDTVAVLLRQYSGETCSETGITFRELQRRVSSLNLLLQKTNLNDPNRIFLFYLPISFLTTALLLSSTISQIRYCLMFEGFSPSAVWELVRSGHVGCVVTTHHNHHHLRPLLQDNQLLSSLVLESRNIKVETDLHSAEISPIFAIYEGGQSSLIAGTGVLDGFYLVTSNLGPAKHKHRGDLTVRTSDCNSEEEFKQTKLRNSYRLDYIRDILNK